MKRRCGAPWGKTRIRLYRPDGYVYFQRDVERRVFKSLQHERKARGVSFQVVAHEAFGLPPLRNKEAVA